MPRRLHYVTFYSPGTFFPETTTKRIGSWDIKEAIRLSKDVVERYSAKPYGFRFSTSIVSSPVPDGEGGFLKVDPKEIATSPFYFLGGRIRTYEQVMADNLPGESILRDNIRFNKWNMVVENTNSFRSTHPFVKGDVLLDYDGSIIAIGEV
jgi:hypothetical protein